MAKERWRRLHGGGLLPLVRAAVQFIDGKQLERKEREVQQDTERVAA